MTTPLADAASAAKRAWAALRERRRWSGGWGYMPSYPADADSTICALRLADALPGGGGIRAWRARAFLARHQHADGGISTYRWPRRMVWHTGLRETFAGWCAPHVCVSANAARLEGFRGRHRLRHFLRSRQSWDGSWRAYWWLDEHEYATALATEALATSSDGRDAAAVTRAVSWACAESDARPVLANQGAPSGSAFAMALRLRVLLLGARVDDLRDRQRAALTWLLSAQRPDGTWPGSAWLRFPPTETVDTTTIHEWHVGQMVRAGVMSDGYGLFTTATVLTALRAALDREPST